MYGPGPHLYPGTGYGTPINTELLRYGFRVVVVAFPAPAPLTSAQALQVVGPQAFGYDVPYRPLAPSSSHGEGTCAAALSHYNLLQTYMIRSDAARREYHAHFGIPVQGV